MENLPKSLMDSLTDESAFECVACLRILPKICVGETRPMSIYNGHDRIAGSIYVCKACEHTTRSRKIFMTAALVEKRLYEAKEASESLLKLIKYK
jgi:hypothetical protein